MLPLIPAMHDPAVPMRRISFGAFELDPGTGELRKGPARIRVPDQSIEILKALLEKPGHLVTRDELRERLWPSNTFVDFEHGLNAAVRRLREALGDSADRPRFIETLPRRGYRFIGSIDGESAIVPASSQVHVTTEPSPAAESLSVAPVEETRRRSWFPAPPVQMRRLLLIGFTALASGIVLWLWTDRGERRDGSRDSVPLRSVAVTSFPGVEADPALSPNGNMVAFAWDGKAWGNLDIYVKLIDSGEPVQLTDDAAVERAPAWSPDGRRIAFLRATNEGAVVVVVPALGGSERLLTHTQVSPQNGQFRSNGLSWTIDGKAVLFVDRDMSSGNSAIFVCSVDTGERQVLTRPGQGVSDTAPAISPDGAQVGFVRRSSGYNLGNVFIQQLNGLQPVGEPRQLTHDNNTGTLEWAHDGGSIIYEVGESGLWRVPVDGRQPQPVLVNVRAAKPSVARDGKRLVYQNTTTDANIWRMPGPAAWERGAPQTAPERVVASTFFDMSPHFSPDGQRMVFVSNRSGSPEIWVSSSDGSRPMPLTTIGGAYLGSPRWSSSLDSIAFDSMHSGTWNIYVVGADGGPVRPVTADASVNVRPSWSRDGRWIYFGSSRSGTTQIWKVAANGGIPTPITTKGGFEAFESPDGASVYYAKAPGTEGIWRVPVSGGEEVQVIDHGRQLSWGVTEHGIVLLNRLAKPQPTVEFFSFESHRVVTIGRFPDGVRLAPFMSPHLAVSRDGEWILFVQYDEWGSDIHMVEGSW